MVEDTELDYGSKPLGTKGEVRGQVNAEGGIDFTWEADKDKAPKFSKWKGMQKIMASGDDTIKFIGSYSSGSYYSVVGVTVKYQGKGNGPKQQFLCLKGGGHVYNECPHTRRLAKYRNEHPNEEVTERLAVKKPKQRKAR